MNPQVIQPGENISSKPWRLEDLLYTLLDTLDMAKIRMVEPDHFRLSKATDINPYNNQPANPLGQPAEQTKDFEIFKWLLPAVVGEMTPRRVNQAGDAIEEYEGLDSVQQVSFDYNPNNDAPPVIPGTSTGSNPTGVVNWNAISADQVLGNDSLQQFLGEQSFLGEIAATQEQLIALSA